MREFAVFYKIGNEGKKSPIFQDLEDALIFQEGLTHRFGDFYTVRYRDDIWNTMVYNSGYMSELRANNNSSVSGH